MSTMDHNQHPSQNARKYFKEMDTKRASYSLHYLSNHHKTSLTCSLLEMLMKRTEGTHSIMNEMPG